ncbi:hypothetical protein Pan265_13920 [Mucisphaera calidilacus]|uniref:Uncharacterized protein n=1 Tax=Mucisphaera calidilacus TaxID=2527982 RepID=A0A518BX39_9BACT|nr:hypothetical protein Pan265_13920 [Mucisphaera calidilacus]
MENLQYGELPTAAEDDIFLENDTDENGNLAPGYVWWQ